MSVGPVSTYSGVSVFFDMHNYCIWVVFVCKGVCVWCVCALRQCFVSCWELLLRATAPHWGRCSCTGFHLLRRTVGGRSIYVYVWVWMCVFAKASGGRVMLCSVVLCLWLIKTLRGSQLFSTHSCTLIIKQFPTCLLWNYVIILVHTSVNMTLPMSIIHSGSLLSCVCETRRKAPHRIFWGSRRLRCNLQILHTPFALFCCSLRLGRTFELLWCALEARVASEFQHSIYISRLWFVSSQDTSRVWTFLSHFCKEWSLRVHLFKV